MLQPLLQVVADYGRLSAMQPAGCAGRGRVSGRNIVAWGSACLGTALRSEPLGLAHQLPLVVLSGVAPLEVVVAQLLVGHALVQGVVGDHQDRIRHGHGGLARVGGGDLSPDPPFSIKVTDGSLQVSCNRSSEALCYARIEASTVPFALTQVSLARGIVGWLFTV
jgi:hypothetical protein